MISVGVSVAGSDKSPEKHSSKSKRNMRSRENQQAETHDMTLKGVSRNLEVLIERDPSVGEFHGVSQ